MCSIAHFSIRICAEASQILGSQRRNRIRDFYARSSALKRFGMEVGTNLRFVPKNGYAILSRIKMPPDGGERRRYT